MAKRTEERQRAGNADDIRYLVPGVVKQIEGLVGRDDLATVRLLIQLKRLLIEHEETKGG